MGKARQLDFIRDTEGGNFLNRICRDTSTKVSGYTPHLILRNFCSMSNLALARRSLFTMQERMEKYLLQQKHVKRNKALQQLNSQNPQPKSLWNIFHAEWSEFFPL